MRFQIAYGRTAPLLWMTGMPKERASIEIGDATVDVKMGWAFSAGIPRSSITGVEVLDNKVISVGVHGWNGRWLVNGAGDRLVRIDIDPYVDARAVMVPIKLRELTVSVEDRDEFARILNER